jgi:hypothetical protein
MMPDPEKEVNVQWRSNRRTPQQIEEHLTGGYTVESDLSFMQPCCLSQNRSEKGNRFRSAFW